MNRNKIIATLIVIAITGTLGIVAYFKIFNSRLSDDTVRVALNDEAVMQNSRCPYFLDNITRLDSVAVDGSRSMHYYYTIFALKDDAREVGVDDLKYSISSRLIEDTKKSDSAKTLLENNITLTHTYLYPDGTLFMTKKLTPDIYGR